MIIKLPRHTTAIMFRVETADLNGSDPPETITLLSGHEPAPAAFAATLRRLIRSALGARRRTKLACIAAGMLVTGLSVSIPRSPRVEAPMFEPSQIVWDDGPPEARYVIPPGRSAAQLPVRPAIIR